ncbi:acyl-CoA dehydrogenase family protein [Streptomyces sp. NPDC003442]
MAAGAALSAKLRGTDQVALADFGDGTSHRGTFHETLIQASVWKLPLIYFCENNGISVSTPFHEVSPTENVADRAVAYGVPGVAVDGHDAVEVHRATAGERSAFGRPLAGHGAVLESIAEARVRIDQLRLMVLHAAWLIDERGARAARTGISAIKVAAPRTAEWVIDQAIQVHGAAGMAQDLPLATLWAQARGLRFADGPDEVHRMVLGRRELRRQADLCQAADEGATTIPSWGGAR